MKSVCLGAFLVLSLVSAADLSGADLGQDGLADSGGVKIHYVTLGEGPLVIMIHGFPDYWYTWRDQMPALAEHFRVVAIDQRGYNKSDQPEGVENYSMAKLVGDVKAVLDHFGEDQATIVGHDWGGYVAWTFAMTFPQATQRLPRESFAVSGNGWSCSTHRTPRGLPANLRRTLNNRKTASMPDVFNNPIPRRNSKRRICRTGCEIRRHVHGTWKRFAVRRSRRC